MASNADEQLLSIVQRIEHVHAEREELAHDVAEIYAEAKGNGFNTSALKDIVAERRRQAKDPAKFEERQQLLALYRARLGMDDATRAGGEYPMAVIDFTVPGNATGKGRPRFTRSGRTFTPAATVNAEAFVKMKAAEAMAGAAPFKSAVDLQMIVRVVPPVSWSKRKTREALSGYLQPICKPDLDNVVKLYADAMNGIVYGDDKQIIALTITRRYCETPSIRVVVEEIA